MNKSFTFTTLAMFFSFNLIGCLSVTDLIPSVKTVDDQGRPIPTLAKKLSLVSEDKEIRNIYITTSAKIDKSKVKLVESNKGILTVEAYIYANSEVDFGRVLSSTRYEKRGRDAFIEVASGNYFCLYSKSQSIYSDSGNENQMHVNGVCLDSLFILAPKNAKISVFVNNTPVYSFRPLLASEIIEAIDRESFGDAKIKIIQTFIDSQKNAKFITRAELNSILSLMTFSDEKQKAEAMLNPGLID